MPGGSSLSLSDSFPGNEIGIISKFEGSVCALIEVEDISSSPPLGDTDVVVEVGSGADVDVGLGVGVGSGADVVVGLGVGVGAEAEALGVGSDEFVEVLGDSVTLLTLSSFKSFTENVNSESTKNPSPQDP